MNLNEANKLLERLEDLRKLSVQTEALYQDLLTVYYPKIQSNALPPAYLEVWDMSLIARLRRLTTPTKAEQFERAIAYLPKHSGMPLPTILFGQLRIGADFQGSATTNQAAISGFPQDQIVGRPLAVVAGMMEQNLLGPDEIPVQIFRDETSKAWIAANNRGFATHCMAGMAPLRLWPRLPEQLELNRLGEVEGKGDAKDFSYAPGTTDRLAKRPHSLPSRQIPVTDGPQSWVVTRVVSLP